MANTSQEDGTSREALQSGEQSIHTVLKEIKDNFDKDNGLASSKILVLLQQLGRAHWVLVEINTEKQIPGNTSITPQSRTTATYHDSKNAFAGTIRNWGDSNSMTTIEEAIRMNFGDGTPVARIYSGKQGPWDNVNCGRYTLEKLMEIARDSFVDSMSDANTHR